MDCSLPGSSAHGIFLAGILEWVAISLFRESSQPSHQTYISCIDRRILHHWASQEAHFYNYSAQKVKKQTNKPKKKKKTTWSSSWVIYFLSSQIQNCPGSKMCLTVKIYPEWSLLSQLHSSHYYLLRYLLLLQWSPDQSPCFSAYTPIVHCTVFWRKLPVWLFYNVSHIMSLF